MKDTSLEARLKRIESAMGDLKTTQLTEVQIRSENRKLAAASKKFIAKPNLDSAKVFLNELDSSKLSQSKTNAAWTTITVTITTILSDDQG